MSKKEFKKSTNAEAELRLATIYEMVVKGCSRKYIVRYCAEKFDIESRQVDVYLQKVNEEIKNTFGKEYKENLLEKHLSQLENLYAKNYAIEDFRECRNIIDSKNKLLGLGEYNTKKIDHTTGGEKINILNLGQGIKPKEDE